MIVDLSHTITEDLPVYPGDPHVKLASAGNLETDGYSDHVLTIGTHNGTHIDAPAHMIAGGQQLKDYPIERFVVEAVCIDVRDGFDPVALRQAVTKSGMGILFWTGTSEYFTDERYWEDYPVLSRQIVDELVALQAGIVGIDTGSFDDTNDFPVHGMLLSVDILLIENLTNLAQVAGKTFKLYALPLKLENDGAPARVIAVL